MAYASWSVVFGEQPSAAKWNILGQNDAVFNNGTGLPSAGADVAAIDVDQTTTSTSFTDLATAGPAVTVTIGATGKAHVAVYARLNNSGANFTEVGYAVSGANTIAATNTRALTYAGTTADRRGMAILHKGLTPGSTTFTMKYSVSAGTGTFGNRVISVVPL